MKVLIRGDMKWYDAKFNLGTNRIQIFSETASRHIDENEIISIQDDERGKYVQCLTCGEVLRNTKKAIHDHCSQGHDEKSCLSCIHLSVNSLKNIANKYVALPDGGYERTSKDAVTLHCGYSYPRYKIDDPEVRSRCKYRSCREDKENFKSIGGFFSKYPHAFDDLITVDVLNEQSWTYLSSHFGDIVFKSKKKFTLHAHANSQGIIRYFRYTQGRNSAEFVYSKKYERIFWIDGRIYRETRPSFISESRYEEIKNFIQKLYDYEVEK